MSRNNPHINPFLFDFQSTDSLEESLLPSKETEAEIIFSPNGPKEEGDDELRTGVKLGGADLGPPGHFVENVEEEGMIMGPSHPIFQQSSPSHGQNNPFDSNELPVPPGARFDPINPVGPGGFYSPGEPDFDELIPPGNNLESSLGKSIHPPRGPKLPGSKSFKPFKPSGHPYGAPPGPGNPPFFM